MKKEQGKPKWNGTTLQEEVDIDDNLSVPPEIEEYFMEFWNGNVSHYCKQEWRIERYA